jgi:hypothetical protein
MQAETSDSVRKAMREHHFVTVHDFFLAACWHVNGQDRCSEEIVKKNVAAFEGPAGMIPDDVVRFIHHLDSVERMKQHERRQARQQPEVQAAVA